jgi:hypothetical protein
MASLLPTAFVTIAPPEESFPKPLGVSGLNASLICPYDEQLSVQAASEWVKLV